ncbi:MAG: hypothetical protein QF636_00340 [Arenicellales bacterium]|jgi:hypothetical protein|nr:hypothetical protein [Arenicellales bacterium]|tara:strand:+ start:158 stop:307 length:150 start_codon:yes stop_codon:yes gene_type:complete
MERCNKSGEFTFSDPVKKMSKMPVKDGPETLENLATFLGEIDLDEAGVT